MELFAKYWGCHQMPERSFFIRGYQMPICARCTGIIIGEIALIIFACVRSLLSLPIGLLLTVPLIFDGFLQLKTKYTSTNLKRLLSGILFGFGFFNTLFSILYFIAKALFG